MATFLGYIDSVNDALILIQACKIGLLAPVSRRLSVAQRANLASGQIFVYNEIDSGIKRWHYHSHLGLTANIGDLRGTLGRF